MITKKLLREWDACWTDERIAEYFGKRKALTPRQIAADETVSRENRLWVLCRAIWYLDESAARGFAIESALEVAHLAGDEDDQALYLGLMNHLLEIEDMPAEQRDAARGAAWDAAWGAAWGAARSAAWGAARGAARGAAWGAARGAAWGAAWEKAITRALEWLGDYADGWK